MKTETASTATRSTSASAVELCTDCGRRHPLAVATYLREPAPCWRCQEIRRRAAWWASAAEHELVERCAMIGVGPQFCRAGQAPAYTDRGIAERLAVKPMPKGGLLILGPCGSHKTHLAAVRTVDAARRGWAARLVNWSRLCLEVRDTYRRGSKLSELDILNRYAGLDYLGIDDLGVGRPRRRETEAALKLAYDLLDVRYAMRRVTDVTTNLLPEELSKRFDPRVMRRIGELTSPYVMLLDEPER